MISDRRTAPSRSASGKLAAGVLTVPAAPSRRNKYRAERTLVDDIWFASKAEATRYGQLKMLERAGQISELKCQVPYPLHTPNGPLLFKSERYPNGRHVKYIADFTYVDGHERIIEDLKGVMTRLSRHKIAHVESEYGVRVRIVRAA